MSPFTGRLGLTAFRKSTHPRTQQGQHIGISLHYHIAKEFHLRIFDANDGVAARSYSSHLKEAEAALARGETPPDEPTEEAPDGIGRGAAKPRWFRAV